MLFIYQRASIYRLQLAEPSPFQKVPIRWLRNFSTSQLFN